MDYTGIIQNIYPIFFPTFFMFNSYFDFAYMFLKNLGFLALSKKNNKSKSKIKMK